MVTCRTHILYCNYKGRDLYLSVCQSVNLSVNLSVSLSVNLSVNLSVSLYVRMYVCLYDFIYQCQSFDQHMVGLSLRIQGSYWEPYSWPVMNSHKLIWCDKS